MRILIAFLFLFVSITSTAQASNHQRAFNAADKKQWGAALTAARATGQAYMTDYIMWRKLRSKGGRGSAKQTLEFINTHKDWPEQERLKARAAEALLLEGYTMSGEKRWKKATGEKRDLFNYGWIQGSFTVDEQKRLIVKYKDRLDQKMFELRADRLLWDSEATRAAALLIHTGKSFRNIARARIAYITRARDAKRKLNKLSSRQRKDDGLMYARIQYHKKKRQHRTVENLLKQLPSKVDHGKKWWKLWKYYAREAMGERRYRDAYNILRPIQKAEHGTQAQLFWLRGWIQLQFLNNHKAAYKDFYQFYNHVGTPISKTRGAFWAGLAAQKNGNNSISRNWFAQGAKYPMSFYGQLSALQKSRSTQLRLSKRGLSTERYSPLKRQLPLIKKLVQYKQTYSVDTFLLNLARRTDDSGEVMTVAKTAHDLGYPHIAVRMGKNYFADHGKWLQPVSHPIPKLPHGLAVEPALALAITRQESEFNPKAHSSAKALGLMQLLPSTARLVAKEHGIKHNTSMLTSNPQHNMKLGSLYLAGLIKKFNGHYPLAIAGYNAGPGRVVQWKNRLGPFPNNLEGQLKWIEQIPFSETRNYVQRVLENLQTYRSLLGENDTLTHRNMFGR